MKLYLTRHGQTEENKARILQGQLEGTLSELGKKQAEKIAVRLKGINFIAIYSSDLKRAIHTSKIIRKYHPHVPFNIDLRLRERHFGPFQGKPWGSFGDSENPLGVEKQEELFSRASNFIEKIKNSHQGENILVVAHGGTNKALVSAITKKDVSKIEHQPNAALSIYEIKEEITTIHLENCTTHLE